MIVCASLVSNPRGCCLAPRKDSARGSLTPRIHTIIFDPEYNMMPTFFSVATNILLIKSNLKFWSRATTVYVTMPPRNFDGKYHSRLQPRLRTFAYYLCEVELRHLHSDSWRHWSCGVFKIWFSVAHHPSQRQRHGLHIYDRSVLQQVGTRVLLHAIFYTWLVSPTLCESQATACDIEINAGMQWIGVDCIFKENIFYRYWFRLESERPMKFLDS